MCLGMKTPKPPPVAPVITKRTGSATSNTYQKRQGAAGGVFSNIFTTPLGGDGFNSSTFMARLFGGLNNSAG